MTDNNPFHLHNTATMSGVHPGSRTAQANVVRWQSQGNGPGGQGWARVLWQGESGKGEVFLLNDGNGWAETPALRLYGVGSGKPVYGLIAAMTETGWQPRVCGNCRWWQPVADAVSADGIPLGLCSWAGDGVAGSDISRDINSDISRDISSSTGSSQQSALALECAHWQTGEQTPALPVAPPVVAPPEDPPVGWFSRLLRRFKRTPESRPVTPAAEEVSERSGVGAGTERCLACHGRIANLGALTVATERDDKRTVSVWRCRLCRTFYLNDWIDRWERLDNLETEESYYRLAPREALGLLTLFRETAGGEHPKERHKREAQRARVDAFLAERPRLLHQIKQGR